MLSRLSYPSPKEQPGAGGGSYSLSHTLTLSLTLTMTTFLFLPTLPSLNRCSLEMAEAGTAAAGDDGGDCGGEPTAAAAAAEFAEVYFGEESGAVLKQRLRPATRYRLRARARNGMGDGEWSPVGEFVTGG
jgi:hypothetical protein